MLLCLNYIVKFLELNLHLCKLLLDREVSSIDCPAYWSSDHEMYLTARSTLALT